MKLAHMLIRTSAVLALVASVSSAESAGTKGFTLLYSFCHRANCLDGQHPYAGLIADKYGNLYGTTYQGGTSNTGTVFELTPAGTETVLHSIGSGGAAYGWYPVGNLVADKAGNLYGTTEYGGADGDGTVFKIAPGGAFSVLYSFQSDTMDGTDPQAGLILDGSALYGTTSTAGANDGGTVFELTTSGSESVLYAFCALANCADGDNPTDTLLLRNGSFFGTTMNGGSGTSSCFSSQGCGTVFQLTKKGVESVLYSFCQLSNCVDGAQPYAGLVADNDGNFYGTTLHGGNDVVENGAGTVFRVSSTGIESVLYTFCSQTNCTDGANPNGGLVRDGSGNLYGTTSGGGTDNKGTVFEVTSAGAYTVLHSFFTDQDGHAANPLGGLLLFKGNLYGTTQLGGKHDGHGTVFKVRTLGG